LGLQRLGVVLQWLGTGEVELVLDDTLCARSGKKVSLASMHADPNKKDNGRNVLRAVHDSKDKLGIEDPQVQRPEAVRRATPMGLLVYSYVVLWYLRDGHHQARRMRRHRDP
jgi:hypothetical protein